MSGAAERGIKNIGQKKSFEIVSFVRLTHLPLITVGRARLETPVGVCVALVSMVIGNNRGVAAAVPKRGHGSI
jgi:hypothetical protein